MEDFDAFDCVSNVFSELHSQREVLFPLTSICLVCENSTLSVNNQCDVVVYGLSGSRSPGGVSPVEESTITLHMTMWRINCKLFTVKRIKACDVFAMYNTEIV